jgi:O-antigen/teichoic acid export membrane protein
MDLSREMGWQALAFCTAMLLAIQSSPMGVLRLFDRFDASAFADTMIPVGRMIGATLALFLMPTIPGFLLAWASAEMLCAVTYWCLALREARGRIGSWRAGRARDAVRENPGIFGFLTATNLQNTLASVGSQISVLILGAFVGPVGAGLYRLAYQLSQSLTKISDLLSRSIFVELSRANSASGGTAALHALFRRASRLGLAAGGIIVLLILLIGKPILGLIAGPDFLAAYPLMLLLVISASINLVGVSYRPLLMATNGAGVSLRITIFATALLLLLLVLLLPHYGTMGAAVASLVASVVSFVLMGWASRRALAGAAPEA